MRVLKQILAVLMLAAVVSLSGLGSLALAQKNDNRPPKDTQKIKEKEKPPPSNSNSQGNKGKKP